MLKGIIFDFDGVIAESVQVKTDAFVELYKQYESNIVEKVLKHHEANGGMSRFEKIKFYHESFLNKTITNNKYGLVMSLSFKGYQESAFKPFCVIKCKKIILNFLFSENIFFS